MLVKSISSLEKCFLDESIRQKPALSRASMLKNERFSFQVAYQYDRKLAHINSCYYAKIEVISPIADAITLKKVAYIPSQLPIYHAHEDSDYLRTAPGLYPDALLPILDGKVGFFYELNSLWVEVEGEKIPEAGSYPITLRFIPIHGKDGTLSESRPSVETTLQLKVIPAHLPQQTTKVTQWFYCDCLQSYYETEAFDEKHWSLIETFLKTAVKNGINMILTPLFTPPLDTKIGGERPTTQLVSVKKEGDKYFFDFSLLKRWVALCDKVGVKYFEINHLFTQWGVKNCPKILAKVEGETKQIFGWDTPAAGEKYASFLRQFIPAFLSFMKSQNGADRRCWFHLSDEPNDQQLEAYNAAREILLPLIEGYPVFDAISHPEFYDRGLVSIPVPHAQDIAPFLERDIKDRWVYYCCGSEEGVPNRFFAMPSSRNRILGTQMYKYGIKGFLHWGYNFYYNQYSYALLNPWIYSDGDGFGPSGDSYLVYPGPHGSCVESLRLKVFYEALQDQRALELCETLYDKDFVISLIDERKDPLTFFNTPKGTDYLLRLREKVNAAIQAKLQ